MSTLNLSPFPKATGDPIPGFAIPVAWLGSPMWRQLAIAGNGTSGDLSLSDGKMSPLDMFHSFHPFTNPLMQGIAVVIVNSLDTPLTLVDCFAYEQNSNCDDMNGPQLSYPAIIDPDTQTVYNAHQIPGMRSYPRPSLHGGGNPGNPDSGLMAVGLYRFQTSFLNYPLQINRGLAFSTTEDGSGPLIGVAFTYNKGYFANPDLTSAVTLDISQQGKGGTWPNLQALIEGLGKESELGKTMTVSGRFASQAAVYEPGMQTLLVYVGD